MILTMDGFERDGGFEALLGDVLRERANPVVPAGLMERVMGERVGMMVVAPMPTRRSASKSSARGGDASWLAPHRGCVTTSISTG